MKLTRMLLVATVLAAAGALPAMAVHFTDISLSADCDGYMVSYSGKTFAWESVDITFTIHLTDEGGNIIEDFEQTVVPVIAGDPPTFGGVYNGTWDVELCGMYSVDGVARVELTDNPEPGNSLTWGESILDGGMLDCDCPEDNPGTGTPGFWMNHACAWGTVEFITFDRIYPKDEAIQLMKDPVKRDKTYSMFQTLVAAKLNIAIGNQYGCIEEALGEAEDWMVAHPVGSGVKASSSYWQAISDVHDLLDDYNNGLLCAPSRDVVSDEKPCSDEIAKSEKGARKIAKGRLKNFPNPFNPVTTIEFSLLEEGRVTLEIYNMLGEKIATLANGNYNIGTYAVQWDASQYASGTYFTRMTIGGQEIVGKLLLVK